MKLYKYFTAAAASLLLAAGFASCGDDDGDGNAPFVSLETQELSVTKKGFAPDGEPVTLNVASNVFWQLAIDEKDTWIDADIKGGFGDVTITFAVEQNQNAARTATMVFETAGAAPQTLTVSQAGVETTLDYISTTFGTGASQANVNSYDAWQPQGVGVVRIGLSGQEAFADQGSPSSGYAGASGGNNIALGKANSEGAILEIGPIGIKQDLNFILSFGSMTSQSAFDVTGLKLYISADGRNWTRLPYDRSDSPEWELTTLPFYIKGGVNNLYFRFVSSADDAYRIDDLKLTEGDGTGENITFIEDEPERVQAPQNVALVKATTTNVAIGWDSWDETENPNTRKFQIEIAATEEGAALQSYNLDFTASNKKRYYLNRFTFTKLSPDTRYFVRIKTRSSQAGLADSNFSVLEVKTSPAETAPEGAILFHNFDRSMWGGDHVLQTWGFRPTGVGASTPVDAAMDSQADPNTGGSGNVTSNAALKVDRGLDGWVTTSVYEFPGYLKIGTSTSTNGVLTTPALAAIQGTVNLKVNFKLAAWVERSDADPLPMKLDDFKLRVVVDGPGTVSGLNDFNVDEGMVWKEFSTNIAGATSATKIKFQQIKATTAGARCCIDDILIEQTGVLNTLEVDKSTSTLGSSTGLSDVVAVTASTAWTARSNQTWLTLSPDNGTGGGAAENVTLTAEAHTGTTPRTATVTFYIGEEAMKTVAVSQDGVTVPQVEAPANLTLVKATTTNVAIGWDELVSGIARKFQIEIAATPTGAALQSYTPTFSGRYVLNRFTIPQLNPDTPYYVRVKTVAPVDSGYDDSDFVTLSVRTEANPVHGAEVVYFHNYDACDWGGDHVLQTWGYRPASVGNNTSPTAALTDLRDPNGGGSASMANMSAELKTSRRISDWTEATTIYENPGFIKYGSASVKGAFSLPMAEKLTATSDLEVSFKLAPWVERSSTAPYTPTAEPFDFEVQIASGSGTIEGVATFTTTDMFEWKEFKATIKNADATTVLKFAPTGPGNKCRCCFDDLLIKTK